MYVIVYIVKTGYNIRFYHVNWAYIPNRPNLFWQTRPNRCVSGMQIVCVVCGWPSGVTGDGHLLGKVGGPRW